MPHIPKIHSSAELLGILLKLGDAFLILLSGALSYVWRFGAGDMSVPTNYTALILASALVGVVVLESLGAYRSWRGGSLIDVFGRMLMGWALAVIILLVALFFLKVSQEYSRLWLVMWALVTMFVLMLERAILYFVLRWLRRIGHNHKRVLIFGLTPIADELIRRINSSAWTGFEIVGLVDEVAHAGMPAAASSPIAVYHMPQDLDELVRREHIQECWITVPLSQEQALRNILEDLQRSTVNIRFVPDIFSLRIINHGVTEIVGMPMIDLSTSPMHGMNRVIKGVEDRVLALLILVLISPLLLLIAIGVKMSSPGPVLFRQLRHGMDGQRIEVWKFRSMHSHEERSGQLTQASVHDARVTQFGAFLRRTSLDELPQFINVLQGSMSIVGPRPHAIQHNEIYKNLINNYILRHKVKPGITGWAQVNGWRGETDTLEKMQRRVEYDLYYIEHWSLAFDLKIIVLTLFRGFVHRNAY
ncbi:MAG: undecaprenyl-phosphate glucose phosphotransferase [Halothiobacillus sp.]